MTDAQRITINDFKKITQHEAINFKGLCDGIGLKYSKLFQAVQNRRKLTEQESKQIEHYLQANGINWQQLIKE